MFGKLVSIDVIFFTSSAVIIVWLLIIFVMTGPFMSWSRNRDDSTSIDTSSNGEMILARLSRAMNELTALKAQNEELRTLLQNYLPIDLQPSEHKLSIASTDKDLKSTPSQEYETTRRRIEFNVDEMWRFLMANTNSSTMKFVSQVRHNLLYDLGICLGFHFLITINFHICRYDRQTRHKLAKLRNQTIDGFSSKQIRRASKPKQRILWFEQEVNLSAQQRLWLRLSDPPSCLLYDRLDGH